MGAGLVLGLDCALAAAPAGSAAVNATQGPANAAPTPYQRAVASFNQGAYAAAATQLDQVPESGNAHDRADVLNLRGAIYLHQHRFEKARGCFAKARQMDPTLWAASFNEAEANFEGKNYGQSQRQFAALLDDTPPASRPQEWSLVQYKELLAALLDGKEQPVRAFLAAHAKDARPPDAYFFLNAALANRQGHPHDAAPWLDKAAANYPAGSNQVYAETFTQLGWEVSQGNRASVVAETEMPAPEPAPGTTARTNAVFSAMGSANGNSQKVSPATLAVVQLIPGHQTPVRVPAQPGTSEADRPAFRFSGAMAIPMPAAEPAVQNNPPGPADELKWDPGVEGGMMVGGGLPAASDLARRKSHPSTPSPSTPTASPDAGTPADSGSASASPAASAGGDATTATASPAASPDASALPASALPAFVQKYEAAYVKFIQKDYDGARELLDEADAIQPHQASSISLRGQIFKHFYEAAYVDYLKSDYPGSIGELNEADSVQANQPDAANLRGLVFSRQHNYEQAENMFKKAIAADGTFWAAKFNLAELPFNYRNYTAARARFEELFTQTDPVKQPREAELTQFKVFLTLLLEGKESGARSFMEHFTFSGNTPARYFCQSALDFYHGDVDKAMTWLDSAKKDYPAQLVSIFIESFYRVGWMTDPAAHTESVAGGATGALPGATPTPAATVPPSAPAVVAASPASTPVPAVPAVVKPTPAPTLAAVIAAATPKPSVAAATLAPSPVSVVAKATPAATFAPTPAATPAPATALATPVATPATVVRPLTTPPPAATPARSPLFADVPPILAPKTTPATPQPTAVVAAVEASPAPSESGTAASMDNPTAATPAPEAESAGMEAARDILVILLAIQIVVGWIWVGTKFVAEDKRRQALRSRRAAAAKPLAKQAVPDKAEAPR